MHDIVDYYCCWAGFAFFSLVQSSAFWVSAGLFWTFWFSSPGILLPVKNLLPCFCNQFWFSKQMQGFPATGQRCTQSGTELLREYSSVDLVSCKDKNLQGLAYSEQSPPSVAAL